MGNPEDLGRYRLKRLLGRGVLGEIWAADDLERPGFKVVVKIMHATDDELTLARNHFAREARLAAMLRHPSFVAVHDAGEAAGTSYMVMDHVEGPSLRKAMEDPATTPAERVAWLRQIADALAAMHDAGIVHRDLKPENVIVRPDRTACLVDLGIAKWIKFDMTFESVPSQHPGAANYVPPEASEEGIYDELGDQWAWGVIGYELLTGAVPHAASPPLSELADVPEPLGAILDRARSTDRGERWVSMDLVLDALDSGAPPKHRSAAAAKPPTLAPPAAPSFQPPPAKPVKAERSPRTVVAILLLLLAVICAIVAALR